MTNKQLQELLKQLPDGMLVKICDSEVCVDRDIKEIVLEQDSEDEANIVIYI